MNNEVMEFDVVIIGAGSAGLSTACRLKQLAKEYNIWLDICVLEKGAEVGSHILSGAILELSALEELFPDWCKTGAPVKNKVVDEVFSYLRTENSAINIPSFFLPQTLHNHGNYIVSLGELCRWLSKQAEQLGVNILTGFVAAEILYEEGVVKGVRTGAKGLSKKGEKKSSFIGQMELRAKFSVFCEGSRGHLGKQLIQKFALDKNKTAQHYALGFKEIWELSSPFPTGKILHTIGWPLSSNADGGGFMYHLKEDQVVVGLTVDLNYRNPYLRPYDEFQRFKQHSCIRPYLENAKRIAYGARSITKGGYDSLPEMSFPGGLLIGCNAGTLNMAKLKGIHTAMKSGMLAAEVIVEALLHKDNKNLMYSKKFRDSWLFPELYSARNTGAALYKWGQLVGGLFCFFEQNILRGKPFINIKNNHTDHECLLPAAKSRPIIPYPQYDNKRVFDIPSSLSLANIIHNDDQPCHLILKDADIPITHNLPVYQEPAQRYCSAGVYEVLKSETGRVFKINAQNCIHCKACDIKDPSQNIIWSAPEGGSGPNYINM